MKGGGNFKRVFSAIGVTIIAFVVNYLITLVLTPYITDNVGTESYGFVTLAKDFAQYVTIATMLINSFASRFIVVAKHRNEDEQANIYYSSAFFGDLALGGLIFALSLVAIMFLEKLLNIPTELILDVKLLFFFLFLKFLINTVFTVYESGAYVSNRLDITGVFKLVSYLVEAAVLFILFYFFPPHVYYVGVAILISALVTAISNVWIKERFAGELTIKRAYFRWSAIKDLVVNGIWSSFNSLGSFLHSGLDLLITNLMLNPLQMGQLAIVSSIGIIFRSIVTTVSTAFQPMLLKDFAVDDQEKVIDTFSVAMKLSSWFTNIGFAGFAVLGLVYFRLWIPHQDIELVYSLTNFANIQYITMGVVYPLFYAYNLALKKVIPCVMTFVSGFFNVVGMYFLIKYTSLDLYAVVGTTVVITAFLNLVLHPIYIARVMHYKVGMFYPNILRCVAACGVLYLLFAGLSRLYMPHSWITLILTAAVYAGIGSVVHFVVVLNKKEWRLLEGKVKGYVKRFSR